MITKIIARGRSDGKSPGNTVVAALRAVTAKAERLESWTCIGPATAGCPCIGVVHPAVDLRTSAAIAALR